MGDVSVSDSRRTAAFRDEIERRRNELRAHLARILAPTATFVWEVGCGHGHFLTSYAEANPHKLCVGIDIVSERIERALRKRDRARLANLFFLHAEARLFLNTLPPGATFSELFILFPDPWPKLRHHKHRIMRADFLEMAAESASSNSQLCFRTDFQPYFEDTQRALRAHPSWQISTEAWPFEFCTVFQSRAAHYHSLIARRIQSNPHS